jgi:hypothetical protein
MPRRKLSQLTPAIFIFCTSGLRIYPVHGFFNFFATRSFLSFPRGRRQGQPPPSPSRPSADRNRTPSHSRLSTRGLSFSFSLARSFARFLPFRRRRQRRQRRQKQLCLHFFLFFLPAGPSVRPPTLSPAKMTTTTTTTMLDPIF